MRSPSRPIWRVTANITGGPAIEWLGSARSPQDARGRATDSARRCWTALLRIAGWSETAIAIAGEATPNDWAKHEKRKVSKAATAFEGRRNPLDLPSEAEAEAILEMALRVQIGFHGLPDAYDAVSLEAKVNPGDALLPLAKGWSGRRFEYASPSAETLAVLEVLCVVEMARAILTRSDPRELSASASYGGSATMRSAHTARARERHGEDCAALAAFLWCLGDPDAAHAYQALGNAWSQPPSSRPLATDNHEQGPE